MKTILFLTALFVLTLNSLLNAQSPGLLWVKASGGTGGGADGAASLGAATDHDGNIIVTGYFAGPSASFGNTTLQNPGSVNFLSQLFVVKYDTHGNIIWVRGGFPTLDIGSLANAVITDVEGNIYITGSFDADSGVIFGSDTLQPTGNAYQTFIAKYDSSGNPVWAKSLGANNGIPFGSYHNYSIVTDASGNVYTTGTYGPTSILAKFNSSGTQLWSKTEPTNNGICADAAGNLYAAGAFTDSVVFGNDTLRGAIFIVKHDTAGQFIWARSIACNNANIVLGAISADTIGNVFVSGYSNFDTGTISFGTNTFSFPGIFGFIARYSAGGNFSWQQDFVPYFNGGTNGVGPIAVNAIATDNRGSAIICGNFGYGATTMAFGGDTISGIGGGFMAKFDSSGNVKWAQNAGDEFDNNPEAVATDNYGNVYLTGSFVGSIVIGGDSIGYNNDEAYGIFTAKFGSADSFSCAAPLPPVNISFNADTICAGNSTVLTVNGTGWLTWYSADTNGTYLGSGSSFATPALTTNTTFYVQDSTCGGTSRTAIIVEVEDRPQPAISKSGLDTLSTNASSSYQWFLNGVAINNATQQVYVATQTGSYQVLATNTNGCADTSAVYNFITAGIPVNSSLSDISLYPNPAQSILSISYSVTAPTNIKAAIFDMEGREVTTLLNGQEPEGVNTRKVNISSLAAGIYMLRFVTENGVESRKFVKE